MYVEYISNKNGYSGSFYMNYPYFKTFYLILKWVKARKLPHFIFIMLCFKTVVATPGAQAALP
jgi:predicted patatin/cPLA2 family phospholipase